MYYIRRPITEYHSSVFYC